MSFIATANSIRYTGRGNTNRAAPLSTTPEMVRYLTRPEIRSSAPPRTMPRLLATTTSTEDFAALGIRGTIRKVVQEPSPDQTHRLQPDEFESRRRA